MKNKPINYADKLRIKELTAEIKHLKECIAIQKRIIDNALIRCPNCSSHTPSSDYECNFCGYEFGFQTHSE